MYLQNVSPAGAVEKQEMPLHWRCVNTIWTEPGPIGCMAAALREPVRHLCPWSDWKPSGKESTVCWEKAPVMCFPFVSPGGVEVVE